jgi:hypothetical protein
MKDRRKFEQDAHEFDTEQLNKKLRYKQQMQELC